MAEVSKLTTYAVMVLIAIGGTVVGILLKIMSKVEAQGATFKHPYFTTMVFFIGEAFCLLLYKIEMWQNRRKYGDDPREYPKIQEAIEDELEIESSPFLFIIPALLDATRNVLFLIAIIFVPASVSNMMGALIVVITTVLVMIFLKKRFYRQHLLGIILIIIGILLVVFAVITNSDDSDDGTSTGQLIFGIVVIVISVCIQGIQFIVEEKLLGNIYVSAKRLTGWEGIWGLCFFSVFLTIAYFIKCEGNLCTNGRLEDTPQALEQIFSSTFLLFGIISVAFFGCLLNALGILITKYTTSAHRATINQVKVVSIWVFFLVYSGYGTQENFLFLQLIGFVILVLGVMTFNEIIVIPIFGFNKSTKAAIVAREYRKSMKKLWSANDDSSEDEKSVSFVIRRQVNDIHALGLRKMHTARTTVFGAGDF